MGSDIIRESKRLYDTGNVQQALQYYASSLWRGEEQSPELLPVWLSDPDLAEKAGEQAVCTFIACLLLVIDRYEEPLRRELWALCHNVLSAMPQGEARQDTTDRYVVECNLFRHEKNPEKALDAGGGYSISDTEHGDRGYGSGTDLSGFQKFLIPRVLLYDKPVIYKRQHTACQQD